MPKTILCDMDSILADFYFGVLGAYEKETGIRLPNDYISAWDTVMPNGKDMYDYFSVPGFFRNLRPVPGAQEALNAMHELGHDILILSAATITHAPGEKYEWLSEHFPWLNRKKVMFATDKYRVKGDVFIDDAPSNTSLYLRHWPAAQVIGIEYPYNVSVPEAYGELVPSYLDFEAAWRRIRSIVG